MRNKSPATLMVAAICCAGAFSTTAARAAEPPPAQTDPASRESAATEAAPQPQPSEGSASEPGAADDVDPTKLVFFNLRLQHEELGDGNAIDLVLLRRDAAIRRRRSGAKFALLRFDVPVGRAHLGGENIDGLGDIYAQAINVRPINPRFSLATGLAFQLPTATEDLLGSGKWQVAPTVVPIWRLPQGAMFFTRLQDFVSFAGDDDRRDVHYLLVNPVYVRLLRSRRFFLIDTEGIADWERGGTIFWKSGLLVGTALRHRRAVWVKLEVPWGEHRRGEWSLRASIAFRGRQ